MADLFTKAKELFPTASDEEITQGITKIKQEAPEATDEQILQTASAIKQSQETGDFQKQIVKGSLRQKYGLDDKYSDSARQKLVQDNQAPEGFNWKAFGVGLGQAIAGKDGAQGAKMVLDREKAQREGKIAEFDKGRSRALEDFDLDRKFSKAEREDKENKRSDDLRAREADPVSEESKLAQDLAGRLLPGRDFTQMSAQQINKLFPSLSKVYDAQQQKLAREQAQSNKDREYDLKKSEADRKSKLVTSTPSGKPLTAGQKKVDEDYAKHYNEFSGQGAVNTKSTIDQLKQFKKELEDESKDLIQSGGGNLGPILDTIGSKIGNKDLFRDKQSVIWKKDIPAKANLVLKKLFGGQLSDDERKSESATYYDDSLGPAENAKKLEAKIKQLEQGYENEMRKAKHYEKYGTLQEFTGEASQFPMQVRKDGKVATVSNAEELKEAKAEGWQ